MRATIVRPSLIAAVLKRLVARLADDHLGMIMLSGDARQPYPMRVLLAPARRGW
jgi:hypothetical protein